ncbi:hypothetical protein B0H10DRAFT_2165191 [Mycena sp. CBHHK59/15]|nr:hypothetical protein B0H10DRAFT_2165191 [Mycena sp. CBHHK59/15]
MNLLLLILGSLAHKAAAHGLVTSPTPRVIGAASLAACDTGAYTVLKSGAQIESAVKKIDSAYNVNACHIYFCKGYQLKDNVKITRVYTPGTVVNMLVDIVAHHTGHAMCRYIFCFVNLVTQTQIGAALMNWPVYANDSLGPPDWTKNESELSLWLARFHTQTALPLPADFNITIPALCWWWFGNNQTFESCVDFTQ